MATRADKVLVIDDETRVRSSLARLLRDAGYEVVGETCGAAALRALKARNYDVVITDVFMPDIDGVAIARAARREHPTCKIIAISGGCTKLSAAIGLQMVSVFGADMILYKPFSGDELIAAMTSIISRPFVTESQPAGILC
jgi:DNA-binding response OmpR family regulator